MARMADEHNCAQSQQDDSAAMSDVHQLEERLRVWETIASYMVQVIPRLKEEMALVTTMTERAVMDLAAHLRVFVSVHTGLNEERGRESLSHIVTALQFQDLTRQRLERVSGILDEVGQHLKLLLAIKPNGHADSLLLHKETIERHFTALTAWWNDTKVASESTNHSLGAEQGKREDESGAVTLF